MINKRNENGTIARVHGFSNDPLFAIWRTMHFRCYNPKCEKFKHYGGRGIKVCRRWHNFQNFLSDIGPRPKGSTLGRIKNDGDYCKSNCRWETSVQQSRNRSFNRVLEWNGKRHCVSEWAEITGLNAQVIYKRLNAGWDVGRTLSK